MGEIPERRIFREEVLKKSLKPYLEIAQGEPYAISLPRVLLPDDGTLTRIDLLTPFFL